MNEFTRTEMMGTPVYRPRGGCSKNSLCSHQSLSGRPVSLVKNIKLHTILRTFFLEHNKTCNKQKWEGDSSLCLNEMKWPAFCNRKINVNQGSANSNVYQAGQVMYMSQLESLTSKLHRGRDWLGQSGFQLYPSFLPHS